MTWDMRITPQALAELEPRVAIRVVVTTIRDAVPRYRVLLPGTLLSARQLSDTEVEVSLSLEAGRPAAG